MVTFFVATAFGAFGVILIINGGLILGFGFLFVSLIAAYTAVMYMWRGWRIGVQIDEGHLLVRRYFNDLRIPLTDSIGYIDRSKQR